MRAHYLMQRHECIAHCVIGLSLCIGIIDSIGRVLLSTPSLTETIRVGSFVETGKKCIYSTGHALTPLTPLAKWQMASRNSRNGIYLIGNSIQVGNHISQMPLHHQPRRPKRQKDCFTALASDILHSILTTENNYFHCFWRRRRRVQNVRTFARRCN